MNMAFIYYKEQINLNIESLSFIVLSFILVLPSIKYSIDVTFLRIKKRKYSCIS